MNKYERILLLQPTQKALVYDCIQSLLTHRNCTMRLYSSEAVEKLAQKYIARGGIITVLKESVLLEYGLAIFQAEGAKATVVKDRYLNEWSSAYTVRMYNKLPKKYEEMLMVHELKKCDGKHKTLEELFACKSCDLLFTN